MTLAELEQRGYTVRVYHRRITEGQLRNLEAESWAGVRLKNSVLTTSKYELRKKGETIAPRGGNTNVQIMRGEQVVAEGEAWCHPLLDNFNKQIGRDVALGRALTELEAVTVRPIGNAWTVEYEDLGVPAHRRPAEAIPYQIMEGDRVVTGLDGCTAEDAELIVKAVNCYREERPLV